MELEELKNKWKSLDKHVKAQDEKIRELTDQVTANKVKSPFQTEQIQPLVFLILDQLINKLTKWVKR